MQCEGGELSEKRQNESIKQVDASQILRTFLQVERDLSLLQWKPRNFFISSIAPFKMSSSWALVSTLSRQIRSFFSSSKLYLKRIENKKLTAKSNAHARYLSCSCLSPFLPTFLSLQTLHDHVFSVFFLSCFEFQNFHFLYWFMIFLSFLKWRGWRRMFLFSWLEREKSYTYLRFAFREKCLRSRQLIWSRLSLTSKWVAYSSFSPQDCSSFILSIPSCISSTITIFVSQLSVQRKQVMKMGRERKWCWRVSSCDGKSKINFWQCRRRKDVWPLCPLDKGQASLWRILSGDSVTLCAKVIAWERRGGNETSWFLWIELFSLRQFLLLPLFALAYSSHNKIHKKKEEKWNQPGKQRKDKSYLHKRERRRVRG